MKNIKIDTGTAIRTILLVLALINQGLVLAGKNTLPFTDEEITNVLTMIFTTASTLWAWWKNNDFTKEAQIATNIMKSQKLANQLSGDQEAQAKTSQKLNEVNNNQGINTDETFG